MAKPSKPASKPVARTEVRNSPVPQVAPAPAPTRPAAPKSMPPKPATPAAAGAGAGVSATSAPARPTSKPVSQELIARRAYEIWASGQGGSELENWIRAERELRGM